MARRRPRRVRSAWQRSATRSESFYYDFTAEHLQVRLAVAIPYLQQDLEAFLRTHAGNPHLKQHNLTRTRNGAPVELLQVGEPGPKVKALVVTARHHACESLASYILEGFLQEAISESPAGAEFRQKYVLFAIPLVDKDGVQAGDQGKNRSPHDHNRDYGPTPLYPEIKAIQDLAEAQQVQYALDLHCPALRGDIHEAFHFLGLGLPHIKDNVNELIAWLAEERPPAVMAPLNFPDRSAEARCGRSPDQLALFCFARRGRHGRDARSPLHAAPLSLGRRHGSALRSLVAQGLESHSFHQ